MPRSWTRRSLMQTGALAAGAAALGSPQKARAQGADDDPRFLFVIAGIGGASIIDSFLPVSTSQTSAELAQRQVVYPDAWTYAPAGSGLRCVDIDAATAQSNLQVLQRPNFQRAFLDRHRQQMAVMTCEVTSVNHQVAQKRSITGNDANDGRTIQEAVAAHHGQGRLLPNVNMAEGGYLEPGDDDTVPRFARAEAVPEPLLFPLATDPLRGLFRTDDVTPAQKAFYERARRAREQLEERGPFAQTFRKSELRRAYLAARREIVPAMAEADLIDKLLMVSSSAAVPLDDYGLHPTTALSALDEHLPNRATDGFEAQAALAYLLAKERVSTSLTLSPSFSQPKLGATGLENTPLAFDFSHTDHVLTQLTMWDRLLRVVDGLIALLSSTPLHPEDPTGPTLYDRSLIYFATEFGRSKRRPAGALSFSSGHHLNNGALLVSPMLRGDRVFGGVDPDTCLTYGFDPDTGCARPDRVMREADVYSAICSVLDVPFPGRRDFPSLKAGATEASCG